MPRSQRIVEHLFAGALIVGSCLGCSNMNNTQKGALVGTAGGAGLGAIVGKQLGNTGAGAAIGAVTGLAAGGLIGNAEDLELQLAKRARYVQDNKVSERTDVTKNATHPRQLKFIDLHDAMVAGENLKFVGDANERALDELAVDSRSFGQQIRERARWGDVQIRGDDPHMPG